MCRVGLGLRWSTGLYVVCFRSGRCSGFGHLRGTYATAYDQIKIAMERMAEFCHEIRS